MQILVIDGHGGKLGRQLLLAIAQRWPQDELIAVGTNATATAAMIKGTGAQGATGENPVLQTLPPQCILRQFRQELQRF